jgi:hypothetical protein
MEDIAEDKYGSVNRVFFGDKQYLSSFEDPATNTVSSGMACPYYLAPYGVSLFDHANLRLPLFKKTEDFINDPYLHIETTILLNIMNDIYRGPIKSKLLYNDESLSNYKDNFCKINTSEVIINNDYLVLCLKILSIITNNKYDSFSIDARRNEIESYELKNNLKNYIFAGRKVYLELQEVVDYIENFP